jgi:hypothetical protein
VLGIDELSCGTTNVKLKSLHWHIQKSLRNAVADQSGLFRIPAWQTDDGWKIRLTAISDTMHDVNQPSLRYQAWSHTWTGPSYSLHDALEEKARRYGTELGKPFVIAVNSFDAMLGNSDFEEPLFGEHGLWGAAHNPQRSHVSAVLFTKNLWPATILMGHVESRLYLNPFADWPYQGRLTKLDTFKFESGSWRCDPGAPINHLLKTNLRESSFWN